MTRLLRSKVCGSRKPRNGPRVKERSRSYGHFPWAAASGSSGRSALVAARGWRAKRARNCERLLCCLAIAATASKFPASGWPSCAHSRVLSARVRSTSARSVQNPVLRCPSSPPGRCYVAVMRLGAYRARATQQQLLFPTSRSGQFGFWLLVLTH